MLELTLQKLDACWAEMRQIGFASQPCKWLRHRLLVAVLVVDEDWSLPYLCVILTYFSACAIETCIQMSQVTAYCIFQVKMPFFFFAVFPPLLDCELWSYFGVYHSDNNNVVGYCSYATLYPIKMISNLLSSFRNQGMSISAIIKYK